MNTNNAPEQDPKIGTWTPAYFQWAFKNLTDEEFEKLYNLTKQRANAYAAEEGFDVKEEVGLAGSEVNPANIVANENHEPEPEPEKGDLSNKEQMEIDSKDLHHTQFKAKYGISLKEYKLEKGGA